MTFHNHSQQQQQQQQQQKDKFKQTLGKVVDGLGLDLHLMSNSADTDAFLDSLTTEALETNKTFHSSVNVQEEDFNPHKAINSTIRLPQLSKPWKDLKMYEFALRRNLNRHSTEN